MKTKWLTTLRASNSNHNEQGFAIPVAMGIGLIMILVASTMMLRSQDDQVTASAQKATARGLSAAETGIARYQALINNNRAIATYNNLSWANASAIPRITPTCGRSGGEIAVQEAAITTWQDVDPPNVNTSYPGDPSKGQYRLVSYTYTPNPGVTALAAPGTGTLTVEGRVNHFGTGQDATTTLSTATTKLVVNVPVISGAIPALWVKSSSITDMGRDKINGNIRITACPPPPTGTGAATSANLKDPATQTVFADPLPLPDTPSLPANRPNGNPSYYTLTSNADIWSTFPRAGDEPTADGVYHYLVKRLENPGNSEIDILPGKKVVFYVQGNIALSGNPDINKRTGNTPNQLMVYGNTYTNATGTPPTTKYGCTGLTVGTNCPTLRMHLNGTGTMQAFILAPDATGSANGGGNVEGNFNGAVLIKDWESSSGNDKVKINSIGSFSDYGLVNTVNPLISPINSWRREGS